MPSSAGRRGRRRRDAHVPSMLDDVRARRPTEVDFITGALVREAARVAVPVPLHTAVYRLVKAREASYEPSQGLTRQFTGSDPVKEM